MLLLTLQMFGCTSPDPMFATRVRRLSVDEGEDELMTTILPQDLVVSLLAERLQVRIHHPCSSLSVIVFLGITSLI